MTRKMEVKIKDNNGESSMQITSKKELLEKIMDTILDSVDSDLPVGFTFYQGIGSTKYEISIRELEDDSFVDGQGNRWIREDG